MDIKKVEISDTLRKGRITELKVLTFFLEKGFIVSTPEVPCPYDFLLDTGKNILKIQVKTSRESDGGFSFNTSSCTHNSEGYVKRTYDGTIDYFCTFYGEHCYLIPFDECGVKKKKLRLVPTISNQKKGISWAEDYLAEKVISESL